MKTRKYFLILSLFFSYYPLFSQAIRGTVFNSTTKIELSNVNIKLLGPSNAVLKTDKNGEFVFDKLLVGSYKLHVSRIGFESYSTIFDLKSEQLVKVNIQLSEVSQVLEQVEVISASRKITTNVQLPFASSVLINPSQSANIPRSTPEALSTIPGLFIQKTNHGGGSPFIRGLTGNQTLILVDGIRLNNSTFRYGPNQYLNTIDHFSIDKIEVLRGSGSVQYGSDAIGGVIQVFTKTPNFSEKKIFKGNANLRYGSGNMEKTGSTELNYSSPNFGFTGVFGLKNFGDIIGGDTTGIQSPSGYSESDASLKLKLKLSKRAELTLANQYVQQNDVDVYHKVKLENFKVNKMALQARNLSYLKLKLEQSSPIFKEINIIGSLNSTIEERNSLKNASLISGLEKDNVRTFNFSVDVLSSFAKFWTSNSGLEYYNDKIKSSRTSLNSENGSITVLRGLYPNNSSYLNTSLYSLHHFQLKNFNIEAGLRHNWLKAELFDTDLGQVEVIPNAFVWNIGLNYALKDHHFYLSHNTGYRAPNIDDLGTIGIVDFRYELPSYSLKPEKSANSEFGYKYSSRAVNLGAALYHNKIIDLITRVQTAQVINGYKVYNKENTEKALIEGVEGFLEWQFSRKFTFDMFASYNQGQNLTKSEPLRRVPPLNGNISLKYKWASIYLKGEIAWADHQNRLANGDREDNRIPLNGTPGWNVINFYSGISLKKIQLRTSIQNLFDVDYRTHGSGINGVGRSLWLNVEYSL